MVAKLRKQRRMKGKGWKAEEERRRKKDEGNDDKEKAIEESWWPEEERRWKLKVYRRNLTTRRKVLRWAWRGSWHFCRNCHSHRKMTYRVKRRENTNIAHLARAHSAMVIFINITEGQAEARGLAGCVQRSAQRRPVHDPSQPAGSMLVMIWLRMTRQKRETACRERSGSEAHDRLGARLSWTTKGKRSPARERRRWDKRYWTTRARCE